MPRQIIQIITNMDGGNVSDTVRRSNGLSESEQEDFEERASIMQYDGGLSREQAEEYALAIIINARKDK